MLALRVAIVLLLSPLMVALRAQTPDTATLQGSVVDATQVVISGARIVLANELTGSIRQAVSDGAGRFSVVCLPVAGRYSVSATK